MERTITSTMAVSHSHPRPESMTGIERELVRSAARADLKRSGCRPIQQLLTYDIDNDATFEIEIPRTVREMEIEEPCSFPQSFTHDPSVGQRIPQNRQRKMTFADFTKDLVEPYILEEITRQMQDAQSHLLNLAEEHHHAFETEILENPNRRMEYQGKNFRKLAMSDQMIRKRVEALAQAAAPGYSIDAENDIVMNAAPALPFAIEPPPLYAAEVAACMINQIYQPWLNEVGRQFIAQKEQLAELQNQVAEAHERRTPLEVAFSEVVRSRGTTPLVNNLRPLSRPIGVTKSSSISSGRLSRQNSPQPPPPEALPATPSPLPRSSTVPAPQAVEQNPPAIRIERERPFAVTGQTPQPTTPQVPGAFVSAIAPPEPAKPSGNVGPPSFTRRSEALAPIGVCSLDSRVVAEGSDIRYAHWFPCLKSDIEALNIWSRPRNDAPQPNSKQNRCGYCESVRYTRHSHCSDFLRDYAVNTRAASQQPPPPPSNPLPEGMDEDVPGEDGFSGYDSPRGGHSWNAGGSGGNLPPRGGNARGRGDPGESDSSLPDLRKGLGRHKSHWKDARREKSDRGCHELAEYLRKQHKGKKSAH